MKILFTGDINVKTKIPIIDKSLQKYFDDSSIISCNLEGPEISSQSIKKSKAGPHIFQAQNTINSLKKMGFNVFCLANNHIFDYGKKALNKTIKQCFPHIYVGAGKSKDAYSLKQIKIDGQIFGFLSFCEAEFGYLKDDIQKQLGFAWVNSSIVNKLIVQSKKKVDFLFVQVHAGVEYSNLPLPEWRERYKEICDLGADAIICHHPHVPQGWERYKGKYIIYSLGNFFFENQRKPVNGYCVQFKIEKLKIKGIKVLPIDYQNGIICHKNSFLSQYKKLSDSIRMNSYQNEIEKLAIERWKAYYLNYFGVSLKSTITISIFQTLFNLLKKYFVNKEKVIDNNLLIHNIRIESHRWLIIRALESIQKQRI